MHGTIKEQNDLRAVFSDSVLANRWRKPSGWPVLLKGTWGLTPFLSFSLCSLCTGCSTALSLAPQCKVSRTEQACTESVNQKQPFLSEVAVLGQRKAAQVESLCLVYEIKPTHPKMYIKTS